MYRFLRLGAIAACFCLVSYGQEFFHLDQIASRVEFASDGKAIRHQEAAVHLGSVAAVRKFGLLSFAFKSDSERVQVNYIQVRKPNGRMIATPASDASEVTPAVVRAAPNYSDWREVQIPVRSLDVGDILEYSVDVFRDKSDIPGQFWYDYRFGENGIADQETFQIAVPANMYVQVLSPKLRAQISETGGRKLYTWHLNREATGDPEIEVQLTTFHNWQEIGEWYGAVYRKQAAVTREVRVKAEELTRGLSNDTDKEKVLYNFVASRFRYLSVSLGAGRYTPHSASEVLENGYGDCKDKHTLLTALLQAIGIEADPAFLHIGGDLLPELPTPAAINHVITAIPQGSTFVWLDTTAEAARFQMLHRSIRGREALVVRRGSAAFLIKTPEMPASRNVESMTVDGSLSPDGTLEAHFAVEAAGDDELEIRTALSELPPGEWPQWMQNFSYQRGFGGDVSNVRIENLQDSEAPLRYAYDYRRPNYVANGRILPPLPSAHVDGSAAGRKVYKATVQMGTCRAAALPEGQDSHDGTSSYHSSYACNAGVFTTERVLISQAALPASLQRDVADDELRYAVLTDSHPGPMAETLVRQAFDHLKTHNLNAARGTLAQARRLNSRQPTLWQAYGLLYLLSDKPLAAIASYKRELQQDPASAAVLKDLARLQSKYGSPAEAIRTWHLLLERTPADREALQQWMQLLLQQKRFDEIAAYRIPEEAVSDPVIQILRTEALLRSGGTEQGIVSARQLAQNTQDAALLNNLAYLLVDTHAELHLARKLAERAATAAEASSNRNLNAAVLDTLGWINFKEGRLEEARKYVEASWQLCQSGVVAGHLQRIRESRQTGLAGY